MVEIFSTTVNRIIKLIKDQIKRAHDAVSPDDDEFRIQVRCMNSNKPNETNIK